MNITESIKFNKLKEENQELKNQLAEKDKEILKFKKEQLFKEDFYYQKICNDCDLSDNFKLNINDDSYCQNCSGDSFDLKEFTEIICFKDNSKYDKLPSKDVK